jgi:hypothetical protein
MDARRFDQLTASLANIDSRRRLLALLVALPLGGALRAFVGTDAVAATRPVRRVQRRADKRRQRKRRRLQHRREVQRRDNGQGSGGAAPGWNGCTPLENLCVPLGRPCCPQTECVKLVPSKFDPVGTCQSRSCSTTGECAARFPHQDVICERDATKCSGLRGSCCLPKPCGANSDCAHSGLCCAKQCCARGQICTPTGCFGGTGAGRRTG